MESLHECVRVCTLAYALVHGVCGQAARHMTQEYVLGVSESVSEHTSNKRFDLHLFATDVA